MVLSLSLLTQIYIENFRIGEISLAVKDEDMKKIGKSHKNLSHTLEPPHPPQVLKQGAGDGPVDSIFFKIKSNSNFRVFSKLNHRIQIYLWNYSSLVSFDSVQLSSI